MVQAWYQQGTPSHSPFKLFDMDFVLMVSNIPPLGILLSIKGRQKIKGRSQRVMAPEFAPVASPGTL